MQLERVSHRVQMSRPKATRGRTLLISRVGHLLVVCAGQRREKGKGHTATGNEGSGYPSVRECGKGKECVSELGWTKVEEEDDSSRMKWSMWRERPPPLVRSLLEISVLEDVLWQK